MDIFVKDLETGEVTQFPMMPNAVNRGGDAVHVL